MERKFIIPISKILLFVIGVKLIMVGHTHAGWATVICSIVNFNFTITYKA